jgi:hypothetical protein
MTIIFLIEIPVLYNPSKNQICQAPPCRFIGSRQERRMVTSPRSLGNRRRASSRRHPAPRRRWTSGQASSICVYSPNTSGDWSRPFRELEQLSYGGRHAWDIGGDLHSGGRYYRRSPEIRQEFIHGLVMASTCRNQVSERTWTATGGDCLLLLPAKVVDAEEANDGGAVDCGLVYLV